MLEHEIKIKLVSSIQKETQKIPFMVEDMLDLEKEKGKSR